MGQLYLDEVNELFDQIARLALFYPYLSRKVEKMCLEISLKKYGLAPPPELFSHWLPPLPPQNKPRPMAKETYSSCLETKYNLIIV